MSVQVKDEKGDRASGFYCDVCDCTLKDSLNYLDHVRGKRHNRNIGISLKNFTDSTLEEVRQMLEFKKRERDRQLQGGEELELEGGGDLDEEEDEEEKCKKVRREKKKRQKARRSGRYEYQDEDEDDDDQVDEEDETGRENPTENDAMAKLMGFSSFSSTRD